MSQEIPKRDAVPPPAPPAKRADFVVGRIELAQGLRAMDPRDINGKARPAAQMICNAAADIIGSGDRPGAAVKDATALLKESVMLAVRRFNDSTGLSVSGLSVNFLEGGNGAFHEPYSVKVTLTP